MEKEMPRATFNITTKDGFSALVTVVEGMTTRQIEDFISALTHTSTRMKEEGFTPQAGRSSTFEKKPVVGQTTSKFEAPPASGDYGTCRKCGAPNKWSTNKNKPYCGAMCWKNGEKTY